ncbi:MAG: MotA/TolQ/ExbB proton channel family protein [Gemmatimonadota bacterium]|nr:MotA/TolQ/ExbB proton channel family protein [Gemmatimonadota bacterium]
MTAPGVLVAAIAAVQERAIDSPIDMVLNATPATKVILIILAAFSLVSWVLIFWKWREFKELNEKADRFVYAMEGARGLHDLHGALGRLEESPVTRAFREGVSFFGDLRPGALDSPAVAGEGLTPTQLDTLWLVLEKNLSQERDELSHGMPWLAIIGSVSPLLGLMGTVVGVMNSFIGITAQGSANIAAVAPGIAEALTTTVTGLAVAIPAVIAYNHYAARLGLLTGELEGFASEFVGTLAREGRI